MRVRSASIAASSMRARRRAFSMASAAWSANARAMRSSLSFSDPAVVVGERHRPEDLAADHERDGEHHAAARLRRLPGRRRQRPDRRRALADRLGDEVVHALQRPARRRRRRGAATRPHRGGRCCCRRCRAADPPAPPRWWPARMLDSDWSITTASWSERTWSVRKRRACSASRMRVMSWTIVTAPRMMPSSTDRRRGEHDRAARAVEPLDVHDHVREGPPVLERLRRRPVLGLQPLARLGPERGVGLELVDGVHRASRRPRSGGGRRCAAATSPSAPTMPRPTGAASTMARRRAASQAIASWMRLCSETSRKEATRPSGSPSSVLMTRECTSAQMSCPSLCR